MHDSIQGNPGINASEKGSEVTIPENASITKAS